MGYFHLITDDAKDNNFDHIVTKTPEILFCPQSLSTIQPTRPVSAQKAETVEESGELNRSFFNFGIHLVNINY